MLGGRKKSELSRGLRRRWVRGSVLIVAAALVAVVLVFSIFLYSYYYSTVRTGLESKAKTATDFFSNYVAKSYEVYYDSAKRYTETIFNETDKLELQFVNIDSRVMISSIGITAGTEAMSPDIRQAIETRTIRTWIGQRQGTNERVMAVSAPMVYTNGEVIGVMRYITSLRVVDRQVLLGVLAVAGVALLVLLLVVSINLVFIRSVIAPVGIITQTSKRIAEGSYGIQIDNAFQDEMGEMVASINEMSLKIAQAEQMKSEFISSISHELRTPLTAITGWGETLAYNETLDADTRGGISIILKEATRLTKMVEELLEFTRMEDGRFTLNVEPIDIAVELEDAIYTYRELFQKDSLQLHYSPYEGDLPLIPGDPNRLKQVFLNIFDNAAKYGREGGRIDITLELHEESIAVIIRDFGPGVAEDEIENVKMKFYKGSNSQARGSGIGLAVCDEIMRYHGGLLELENAEGGGLRVTCRLPITIETLSEDV